MSLHLIIFLILNAILYFTFLEMNHFNKMRHWSDYFIPGIIATLIFICWLVIYGIYSLIKMMF